ncbi:hypothetical protein HYZ76_00725 [Candidatus Falkowbacteria bacterium]|nr:hypothetical protein [Candidatus Falkowbacteria bacterium]
MEYLEAKINQLIVEKEGKQKNFIRTFTTKPPSNLSGRLGKIFGLIEIGSSDADIPFLIDLIIDEIKNNYYRQSDYEAGGGTIGLESYFETALKKTNMAIAAFLESEQLDLNLKKINIIIAVIHNQEIHFTVVGNVSAILLYNIGRNSYRIINILDSSQVGASLPEPLKIFSQIISGKIRRRDLVFISTANILDYFSLERIKNILTNKATSESMAELKNLLEIIKSKESFGSLSLEIEKKPEPVKNVVITREFDYVKAASQDSIKELINTEKETAKLLTPSILPELKKYAGSLGAAFKNYLEKARGGATDFYKNQKIIRKPELNLPGGGINLKPGIEKISKFTSQSKQITKPVAYMTSKAITGLIKNPVWKKIKLLLGGLFGIFYSRFRRLPLSSKLLLIGVIVLAFLFTSNVVWLKINNEKQKKLDNFNQIILDVTDKKNEAESSLIYRDESQARELLVQAKTMLFGLTADSKEQEDQINNLNQEIETKLYQLSHIVEITEPIQIVNFKNLGNQAVVSNVMLRSGNAVYTQNQTNQSIYKADLNTRVMSAIFSPGLNSGNFNIGTNISDNELLFFSSLASVFQLDTESDSLQNLTINISDNSKIVDAAIFNNRLYLLDQANDQIYRYSRTASGFGGSSNWVSQGGIDLAEATSFAIDGSIYVLKSNGEIIKFQNGARVDFKNKAIDPPLKSANKIKTTEGSSYLYILDPATKRLAVLDKEGNLINQYISESFDDLKDFIVDEQAKKIYVLNGGAVIGITAEHL